jgi:hypothetical protein
MKIEEIQVLKTELKEDEVLFINIKSEMSLKDLEDFKSCISEFLQEKGFRQNVFLLSVPEGVEIGKLKNDISLPSSSSVSSNLETPIPQMD